VKQIVGSTLADEAPVTNFDTDRSAAWYADLYRRDNLRGGHVIMLGPGNEEAARQALAVFPGGLQVGGGVTPANARQWLEAGASHVIVSSHVFREGKVDWDRVKELVETVSRRHLVLDLSCRKKEGRYYVVTDRWRNFTDVEIDSKNLLRLASAADEFLVHATDIEGKLLGVDTELISLLANESPIPTTYAGGVRNLDDLRQVHTLGQGRLHVTVGSALDIFGGPLDYRQVVALCRRLGTS